MLDPNHTDNNDLAHNAVIGLGFRVTTTQHEWKFVLKELFASLAPASIVIPSKGKCLEEEEQLKKNADGIIPHRQKKNVLVVW